MLGADHTSVGLCIRAVSWPQRRRATTRRRAGAVTRSSGAQKSICSSSGSTGAGHSRLALKASIGPHLRQRYRTLSQPPLSTKIRADPHLCGPAQCARNRVKAIFMTVVLYGYRTSRLRLIRGAT